MMLIWVFFYRHFYNISNRLVSTAANHQKAVENYQKSCQNTANRSTYPRPSVHQPRATLLNFRVYLL
jgi:hypothetical protein